MIAMLLGALASTLTVAWVLYPIFAAQSRPPAPSAPADDPVEALIRRYRPAGAHCPRCGPRPESDAAFCSSCGRPLGGGSAETS